MSEFINKGINKPPFINEKIVPVVSKERVEMALRHFNHEVKESKTHFGINYIYDKDRIIRMSCKEILCKALLIKMTHCE